MPRVDAWPSRRMNSLALRAWVGGAITAGLAVCAAGGRRLRCVRLLCGRPVRARSWRLLLRVGAPGRWLVLRCCAAAARWRPVLRLLRGRRCRPLRRLRGRRRAGGCGCCAVGGAGRRLLRGRWCAAAAVAARCRRGCAVAVPWRRWRRLLRGGVADGGDRHAVLARPRAAAAGSVAARSRCGLRRLLLGCRCLLRLLLRGRRLRWRAAAAFGRALLAALLRRRRLRRGWGGLRLRALSRRSRRSSGWRRLSRGGGGGGGCARGGAAGGCGFACGGAGGWASALQPAAVRACRAFRARQPALRRTAHRAARQELAEGSAAIVSNAVLVSSSDVTFRRICGREFMV